MRRIFLPISVWLLAVVCLSFDGVHAQTHQQVTQ
jgi:hypothetical protein